MITLVESGKHVLILFVHCLLVQFSLIWLNEPQEVGGAMGLVVELFGVPRNQPILDVAQHPHPHEVVVPDVVTRNHEEP